LAPSFSGCEAAPKGPRGEKRPGGVIGAAIMVAKIVTGEVGANAGRAPLCLPDKK
jgi:hypothetical protein